MTMFDEMGVGIHLPIGDLNAAPLDVPPKELQSPPMKSHHHHDEESQLYSYKISLPVTR